MSFKQFIPDVGEEWDAYWKKTSVKDELSLVKTDGLKPIFNKHLLKQNKILEAGCGLGKWIITLSQEGYNIQGVDTNVFALDKLKKHFPKAQVQLADVRELPFEDEIFDAYLSLGVIEHFEKGPQAALKEAYRVLKKDGLAIVEVPFDSPLRKFTRFFNQIKVTAKTPARMLLEIMGVRNKREKIKMRFYEYRFTLRELKAFMDEVGFSDISIEPKDDLDTGKSIALWTDYPKLQNSSGIMFELNNLGRLMKKILDAISPFSYCALIVAIVKKK